MSVSKSVQSKVRISLDRHPVNVSNQRIVTTAEDSARRNAATRCASSVFERNRSLFCLPLRLMPLQGFDPSGRKPSTAASFMIIDSTGIDRSAVLQNWTGYTYGNISRSPHACSISTDDHNGETFLPLLYRTKLLYQIVPIGVWSTSLWFAAELR